MARRAQLADRIAALGDAAELSRGRSPDDVVQAASDVVQRADERLRIAGDHTVIALAGATGSGKSSLFNALSGTQLAATGVTRPTTSQAMSAVWGTELPTTLLDWLEVQRRHLIAAKQGPLTDLVLLDLPDHDSTEVSHRLTVDRLVKLVDMLVWVVDPQKYADAALHDGYLIPLREHAEVMVVVLNQADRLEPAQLQAAQADLRRLLDAEGLQRTPVVAASALTGQGIPELRALLEEIVAKKTMTARRYGADVTVQAAALSATLGSEKVPTIAGSTINRLNESLGVAAGVPVVVDAVREAWKLRGSLATGWPVLKWLQRFRPDPLRRLRVGISPNELSPTGVNRTSLPKASPVQRAHLDAALRELIDVATPGLPRGWAEAVRVAARGHERVLADKMDAAVAGADLSMGRGHAWWAVVNVLQWLLFIAAVVGLLWLLVPVGLAFLQLQFELPQVQWWGFPAPTVLLVGGAAAGILVALLSKIFVNVGASLKARAARQVLTERIASVTSSDVIAPVRAELDRLEEARDLAATAR